MKPWTLTLFAVLIVIGLAVHAPAASAGGYSISANGGAGIPTGDYGDVADVSWNLGGAFDFDFSSMWGAGVDLAYHSWGGTEEYNAALTAAVIALGAPPGTTVDATFHAFQYGVHGTLQGPAAASLRPYVQAGVAGYALSEKLDSNLLGSTDLSKTKFGWNVGAGALFSAAPTVSLGVDGHYHFVSAEDDYGGNFSWFTVQGRVVFHIPLAK